MKKFMFFDYNQLVAFGQLALAALLGGLMGLEREYVGKAAGMRTYSIVSLGAALFTILSINVLEVVPNAINFDPGRIAAQIVVGVGFLGAGLIIFREQKVQGLTTAAGLWTSAAVGTAVGFKFYWSAIFTSLLVLFIFTALIIVESWIKSKRKDNSSSNKYYEP